MSVSLRHGRSGLVLAALAALKAGAACRPATPAQPPERFLSARAEAALVVPDLSRAASELSALEGIVGSFPGMGPGPSRARSALAAQLGFDPLDPAALSGAGVDRARGAALGLEPGTPAGPVLILPVGDAGRLEGTLERLARERLGAPQRSTSTAAQGALRVVTFRRAAADPPALAYALSPSDRVLALAPGPAGPEAAAAALSRPAAESLAEVPAWKELRKAAGDRYALLAGAVPPSPRLRFTAGPSGFSVPGGLVVGASATAGSVRLGVAVRPEAGSGALRALHAAGDARAAVRTLSTGAALVLAWNGDPAQLGQRLLARASPRDLAWLAAHGFDLQRDLFDRLAPGAAASISLSPRLDLSGLDPVALRADPLRVVRFELSGEVKEEAAARASLARLPALLAALAEPEGGLPRPQPAPDPTGAAGRVRTPSGEIAWRLAGKRLLLAGGPPGALDALAARGSGAGYAAPTKASAGALEGGLGGAVLDPRSLSASLRALPDEAYGTGPTSFVVRSVVERFLEPAERIAAVSLRAEPAEAALLFELLAEVPPAGKEAGR